MRTAFNLLGPLTNPAGATRQLVGVPRPEFTELMARALMLLGSERAWVVHGADGIDEISTTGYTKISECRDGAVNTFYLHPADVGLPKAAPAALQGGDAHDNARDHRRACSTASAGAARDVVLLNAGAALFIAGAAASVDDGIAAGARARSIAATRGGRSTRLVAISTAEEFAGGGVDAIAAPADLLATIVAATRRIVEVREAREPLAALRGRAARAAPSRRGTVSRRRSRGADGVNVIAECKRRSPSKGVLRADYDPVAIARGYAAAGRGGDLGADRADVLRRLARRISRRCARRSTCRCCARTSSSPSISCSKRRPPAPTRCC